MTKAPWLAPARVAVQRRVGRVLHRPVEDDFRALPLLGIPAGAVCVDVGANRGLTIDAMRMFLDDPTIHAIEPLPELATRLRRDRRLVVHAVAVADEPGTARLIVPSYGGYEFDGLASFDEAEARDWLDGNVYGYDPARLVLREVEVPVVRIDDLGIEPRFMKLDVQGHEELALRGARRTLEQHRPALLVESPKAATADFLGELGYSPFGYTGGVFQPGVKHGLNTFFLTTPPPTAPR